MPPHVNSPFTLALRNTEPLIDAKQNADPDPVRRTYAQIKDAGAQPTKTDSAHPPHIIKKNKELQPFKTIVRAWCRLFWKSPAEFQGPPITPAVVSLLG